MGFQAAQIGSNLETFRNNQSAPFSNGQTLQEERR